MTPFGVRLKFFRQIKGYSQQGLAEAIGWDCKRLSAIETGRARPPDDAGLKLLARVLKLDRDEEVQLANDAACSSLQIRLPPVATPEQIAFVHLVVRAIDDPLVFAELKNAMRRAVAA